MHELICADNRRPGAHALQALFMPGLGGRDAAVGYVDDGVVAVEAIAGGGLYTAVGSGSGHDERLETLGSKHQFQVGADESAVSVFRDHEITRFRAAVSAGARFQTVVKI